MVNFLETDFVASEESADRYAVAVPSDATVRADESGLDVSGGPKLHTCWSEPHKVDTEGAMD